MMRNINKFENGFSIRYDDDDIKSVKEEKISDMEQLCDILWQNDIYIVGDEFCLSNWNMGCLLYDLNRDLCFIWNFDWNADLLDGKVVKLENGYTPDEDDRKAIEESGF